MSAALPDEIAVAAITFAELAAGALLARTRDEAARRQFRLQELESALEPIPFDAGAVRAYGLVVAAVVQVGRSPRSRFADILIAATALSNGLDLYTRNGAGFVGLGSLVRVVEL